MEKRITYVRYNVTVGWGAEMHANRFAIPHANRLSRYRIPYIRKAFPQHHWKKRYRELEALASDAVSTNLSSKLQDIWQLLAKINKALRTIPLPDDAKLLQSLCQI